MGFMQYAAQAGAHLLTGAQTYTDAKYQQKQNASIADYYQKRGEAAVRDAQQKMRTDRRDAESALSSRRAASGASGVAPSGTSAVNETTLASRLEQNIRDTAHQAMRTKQDMDYQADMSLWSGKYARESARSRTLSSTLLAGANLIAMGVGNE